MRSILDISSRNGTMKAIASTLNLALERVDSADIDRLPSAHKAGLIQLSPQTNVEQLFELMTANCLVQIKDNAAALTQSYDAEALHQMRVGLRRLRVALDLFKHVLQLPAKLQQELDWLNTQLCAARDWDVLAQSTLSLLTADLPKVYQRMLKLPAVKRAIFGQARQQHTTALTALNSQRYLNLMQQLTSWIDARGWRSPLSVKRSQHLLKPAALFARTRLLQKQQRLVKRGQRLACTCAGVTRARDVHRLRLAAKTMRYTTEFFQSLYPIKQVRPAIAWLSKLQLRLGWMNDIAVAYVLLQQLQQQHPQLALNIHLLRAYMRLRSKRQAQKISALWKKYKLIRLAI
jgi:CHAD domain-containing protein